ncbi:MAG: TIR domain-containing protein [Bacteroidales bacterium]|nr:TIR domain-containing protein [Bacteroidales bacterium]
MKSQYKYYAFISYSHRDEEWAKWLQHEFEHYHLPTSVNRHPNLPENFRPIFRDIDELSGGQLGPQISQALASSAYLVVICSPWSAKSPYVSDEIREFITIGQARGIDNEERIFPYIVDGIPHDRLNECFPQPLKELSEELIAGDATKHGREHAFVKVLAGTLRNSNIDFGMLWNQFERDRIEEERKKREERDRLLLMQSRLIAEKSQDLVAEGDSYLARRILLEALPNDMLDPEARPYCPEAECALRNALHYDSAILPHQNMITSINLHPNHRMLVSSSMDGTVKAWDLTSGKELYSLKGPSLECYYYAAFNHQGTILASSSANLINDSYALSLWGFPSLENLWSISTPSEVTFIRFFYNDNLLLTSSNDHTLRIWEVASGKLLNEVQYASSYYNKPIILETSGILIYPDGNDVTLLDLNNHNKEKLTGHSDNITFSSYDYKSQELLTACEKEIIRWDLVALQELEKVELKEWEYPRGSSPEGLIIYNSKRRCYLLVRHSYLKKQHLLNFKETGVINMIYSSAANQMIIADNNAIHLCPLTPKSTVVMRVEEVDKMAFFGLNQVVFVTRDKNIEIYDLSNRIPSKRITSFSGFKDLSLECFLAHGQYLLMSHEQSLFLVDLLTEDIKELTFDGSWIDKAFMDDTNRYLVALNLDSTLSVWDVTHERPALLIASQSLEKMSPDAHTYLKATENDMTAVIDVLSGKEISIIPAGIEEQNLDFSADSKLLVSAPEVVYPKDVWKISSGQHLCALQRIDDGIVVQLLYSEVQELIIGYTTNHKIIFWDASTGRIKTILEGHTDTISHLLLSHSEQVLASLSRDGWIKVWDIATASLIMAKNAEVGEYINSMFNPDDTLLMYKTGDDEMYVLEIEPLQEIINRERNRFFSRQLTEEQKRKYYL